MKLVNILKEWKLLLLAGLIITAFIAVHPFSPTSGVLIEGVRYPAPDSLRVGQVIVEVNGLLVNNLSDYEVALSSIRVGDIVRLKYRDEVGFYSYVVKEAPAYLAVARDNETSIGLTVGKVSSSNLQFGLEIVGGVKVLLAPNHSLTSVEADNLVSILKQRLNLFGLKEVPVNFVTDLSGNQYVRIEFAGATEGDVKMLLEKQGDFAGRINNVTVFTGDDLVDVCVSGVQCTMRVYPVYAGSTVNREVLYKFEFQVDLTQSAAERFANVTSSLPVGDCGPGGCYLNSTLDLYLDDELIQDGSLNLPESIKGEVLTSATITGTRSSMKESQNEMRRLQAILQSRSLPVKLNVVSVESLSPSIGEDFAVNIFSVLVIAVIVVALIIGLRYRSFKVSLPIIFIILVELVSTLGITSLMGVTLDLSAIAGLLASVGTSLDDQIIITDEVLSGESVHVKVKRSVRKRIKEAFFVVVTSFMAGFASLVPLVFAGAGLLRGFALTSMVSLTIGVLITRPAFARIIELLFKD